MTQKMYIDMFIGVGTLVWSHYENLKSETTGIPRLVRFFGPQATALFENPH